MNSGRSPNESEYGITPGQSSHENLDLRSNNNPSNMVSTSSIEHASENSSDTKPYLSLNSNAIIGHQRSSIPIKHRRYKITVMHSDVPSDTSSHKLPSIVSKNRSTQTRKNKT
jgi:hypothetical protein